MAMREISNSVNFKDRLGWRLLNTHEYPTFSILSKVRWDIKSDVYSGTFHEVYPIDGAVNRKSHILNFIKNRMDEYTK